MVNHSDLMDRINNGTDTPPELIEDMDDPGKLWKDVDLRAGHKRIEFSVPLSKIAAWWKKRKST